MSVAIGQIFIVVLYVILVYAHAKSQGLSDAKDHKAGVNITTMDVTAIEMGFLALLAGAALVSLHMGWRTVLIIPTGFLLWRATYTLEYGYEMKDQTGLHDVSAEIMLFFVCLVGML